MGQVRGGRQQSRKARLDDEDWQKTEAAGAAAGTHLSRHRQDDLPVSENIGTGSVSGVRMNVVGGGRRMKREAAQRGDVYFVKAGLGRKRRFEALLHLAPGRRGRQKVGTARASERKNSATHGGEGSTGNFSRRAPSGEVPGPLCAVFSFAPAITRPMRLYNAHRAKADSGSDGSQR